MVVRVYGERITVRFGSRSSKTNTHLLGPDGAIEKSHYSLVRVKRFEIVKISYHEVMQQQKTREVKK